MSMRIDWALGVVAAWALLPAALPAQTGETDEVQQIHPPKVKPAEDEKPDMVEAAKSIVQQTNDFRKTEGRQAVKINAKLQEAAQYFADYMARTDRYGHTADGEHPSNRAKKHGYDYCIVLENIAYQYNSNGFATADLAGGFFKGWKESPGHRRNMLDADVIDTAVAISRSKETGYYYAVQMFGRPKSDAIVFKIGNRTARAIHYQVGEQRYVAEPNYTTTHTCCRPPELSVQLPRGESSETATRKPANGEQFVVVEEDGRFVLKGK